jgi:transcriptional regulator with PAS, ATPase and Fis domain
MDFSLIEVRPGNTAILLPDTPKFTVVAVSNDFVAAAGISREELIGSNFFSNFPKGLDNPHSASEKIIRTSFEQVLQSKQPHAVTIQRYDILKQDDSFEKKYWRIFNTPVLNNTGDVHYVIHTSEDVTDQIKISQQVDQFKEMRLAFDLFMQAPVAVCIVNSPKYVVELANDNMLQLLGRTSAMVGKRIKESLPEANVQGLIGILDQ